jgi:hypothetical protein
MTQANSNDLQYRKIKRTICIGLGGTGRDVLMRIRRLIVDRYGDLAELPIVSFVHIDTDKGASHVSGLRTGNTYHGVDLSFRDAEKVAATMSRSEVNNFAEGLKISANDREGVGVYDHIARWFPPQLLKDLKTIDEGAKGIRPVGRLAFFHNYRKIKNALETAERRTRGHESFLIKKGFIVEPNLNIFAIGSLCGGTGSGIFLDTAYCLRGNYGDRGAQIYGYFIITPELYGNTPNMNANTYAALKELNYYASNGTEFIACYDPQNLEIIREQRPPFDYVYLVADRTAKDYKILDKNKLCNVIANKIIIDFASEIAPIINAQRDNFLIHMINKDDYPRPNVQRYLTFGLAQIYFPRDLTVQVSLNILKRQLLNFWLNGQGQSPDPQMLLEQFLLSWYGSDRDGLVNKLKDTTIEKNKNFNSNLTSWINSLEIEVGECKTAEDRRNLIDRLNREIKTQFRKVQPGDNDNSRGLWLTVLQQQTPSLIQQLKQGLDIFISELLRPNNVNFCINNTRAFLEALLTEINQNKRNLEEKFQSTEPLRDIEYLDSKWKDIEQILNDGEQKSGFAFFGNKNKNNNFQEDVKANLRTIKELFKNNFEFTALREGLEIVNALQEHIKTIIDRANSVNNLIRVIQNSYERKEIDLKQLDKNEMSGEAIFAEGDTNTCFEIILPVNERRSQLVLVSGKITEQIGLGESFLGLLERNLLDEKQLEQEIDLIVDRFFASRSNNLVQSAIARFLENYSLGDRSTRLEQILREGEPLLPLNLSDPYFYNDKAKQLSIIGFKDSDAREVQQFKTILTRDLGIEENVFKAIQTEDEILIISEYAAFPLRLIEGLENMKQHYIRQQNYGITYLHNDYRTLFTDIIPPEAYKIRDLQDVFYPCLAFELLEYDPHNKYYQFPYYDRLRGSYQNAILPYAWDEALEQLINRQDIAIELKSILERAIADLENQPNRWEEHYLPKLRDFVNRVDNLPEEDANFPYKDTVVGTRASMDKPAKEGIISRFYNRIQKRRQEILLLPNSSSETSVKSSSIETEIVGDIVEPIEDPLAKLKELVQMKKEGLLSEEEFERAKKVLLGL